MYGNSPGCPRSSSRRQVLARVQRLDLDARIREAARIIGADDRRHGQIRRRVLVLDGHGVQVTPLAFGPMRRLAVVRRGGRDARLRHPGERPGLLHRRLVRDRRPAPPPAPTGGRSAAPGPSRGRVRGPGSWRANRRRRARRCRASTSTFTAPAGTRIIGYRLWRSVSRAAESGTTRCYRSAASGRAGGHRRTLLGPRRRLHQARRRAQHRGAARRAGAASTSPRCVFHVDCNPGDCPGGGPANVTVNPPAGSI